MVNNSPVQWTVTAVFDSATLTELAEKDRSSAAADGRQKRDFDFELRLIIGPQTPVVRSWLLSYRLLATRVTSCAVDRTVSATMGTQGMASSTPSRAYWSLAQDMSSNGLGGYMT